MHDPETSHPSNQFNDEPERAARRMNECYEHTAGNAPVTQDHTPNERLSAHPDFLQYVTEKISQN